MPVETPLLIVTAAAKTSGMIRKNARPLVICADVARGRAILTRTEVPDGFGVNSA
jgi:hypothetical protein